MYYSKFGAKLYTVPAFFYNRDRSVCANQIVPAFSVVLDIDWWSLGLHQSLLLHCALWLCSWLLCKLAVIAWSEMFGQSQKSCDCPLGDG